MDFLKIKNIGLWFTLLFNIFLFGEYLWNKSNADSIVFIFWVQSLLLGAENILMMLFARTKQPLNVNGEPAKTSIITNIFATGFFTFHYGIFIFFFGAVAVFSQMKSADLFTASWVYPTLVIMVVMAIIEVPGKILEVRRRNTSLFGLMFMPYLRLIPFAIILFGSEKHLGIWMFPLFMLAKLLVDVTYLKFFNFNQSRTELTV